MSDSHVMQVDSVTSTSTTSSASTSVIRDYYVVTAHKSTNVTHSIVAHFTSPTTPNLILARGSRLDVFLITGSGLAPFTSITLYAHIASLLSYRSPTGGTDRLVVTTDRTRMIEVAWDEQTSSLITKTSSDLSHKSASATHAQRGHLVVVDSKVTAVIASLYDGLITLIPIDAKRTGKESFDMRIDELRVNALISLSTSAANKPLIAILYTDAKSKRAIKTYIVDVKERELKSGPWQQANVDKEAASLVPMAQTFGGLLCFGEESITYYNGTAAATKAVNIVPTQITAVGAVDDTRFLFGQLNGTLSMLVVSHDSSSVVALHVESLGLVSTPHTLTYIDSGFVFNGSTYGDSQLLRLSTQRNDDGSYVDVIDTFTHIGGIQDFALVDRHNTGQSQMITCSGGFQNGSLRIIRNGIGITEEAAIDLPGMTSVWSLKSSSTAEFDKFLVESFVGETRVLSIDEEELGEIEIAGFDANQQTLFCGNVSDDMIVQVTPTSVRLVRCSDLELADEWLAPSPITVASASHRVVLVAVAGARLHLLNVNTGRLVGVSSAVMSSEVSCADLCAPPNADAPTFAVVSLWSDLTVRVLSLPSLRELSRDALGGDVIARSILIAAFGQSLYVIAGIGDGGLVHWCFDANSAALSQRKRLQLGTQPVTLRQFVANGAAAVFASCDRPTVVYFGTSKLLFSNVNLLNIAYMAPFHTSTFQHCLAFASASQLIIGRADDIQKLHIRTVPLNGQPRRLVYSPQHSAIVVLWFAIRLDESDRATAGVQYRDVHFVTVRDVESLDVLSEFELEPMENGSAIVTTQSDGESIIVVGTAYVDPDEPEPTMGRLLVFRLNEQRQLTLTHQIRVRGAVYCLAPFRHTVMACINSRVAVYAVTRSDDGIRLSKECERSGFTIALSISVNADGYIAVADVLKSVSILYYTDTQLGPALEEVSRHYEPAFMHTCQYMSDNVIMCVDISHNLYTTRRITDGGDEERARVEVIGRYHAGDLINRIEPGSLVMNVADNDNADERVVATHVYGTASGAIGVIAPLTKPQYAFWAAVEEAMEKHIAAVGELSHSEWRAFKTDRRSDKASQHFIDGDLIELFTDLPAPQQERIAAAANVTLIKLAARIEEMSRIH